MEYLLQLNTWVLDVTGDLDLSNFAKAKNNAKIKHLQKMKMVAQRQSPLTTKAKAFVPLDRTIAKESG